MKKYWATGLLMVVVLLGASRLVAYWFKPKPSYQGYSVSRWLKGLGSTNYLVREQAHGQAHQGPGQHRNPDEPSDLHLVGRFHRNTAIS